MQDLMQAWKRRRLGLPWEETQDRISFLLQHILHSLFGACGAQEPCLGQLVHEFFEGFSCWKKERKRQKPKTPKNQQKPEKLAQQQQKKTPTHKNNLACHQKSELQNKPRKTKIQQWVVSKGRIEEMVQKP